MGFGVWGLGFRVEFVGFIEGVLGLIGLWDGSGLVEEIVGAPAGAQREHSR